MKSKHFVVATLLRWQYTDMPMELRCFDIPISVNDQLSSPPAPVIHKQLFFHTALRFHC